MSIPPDIRTGARQFGLLPRRKLPQLPPKGEPWQGLLRPSTLILLGVAVVLIAGTWIGIVVSQPNNPTTIAGVTAEAVAGVDELTATLPGPPAASSDESVVQACPDGSAKQQVVVTRTITPAAGTDVAAWIDDVSQRYRDQGWNVERDTSSGTDTTGSAGAVTGSVSVSLIGPALIPYVITVPSGAATVIIGSESRCAAEG